MKFPDSLADLPIDSTRSRVYGAPYQTPDGATVIPVFKARADSATPIGVFVIHRGVPRWSAAINGDRVALIGVITGLIAAVLGSLAVLRRPPWPDLSAASTPYGR
ncbi:hypothetical protein [Mycobacterium sp.]|uniref:hypothetical protein n=1 Tax=Mycobacterium sp. TaxID=1785 RepID=UPI0025D1CCB0|nr:hypothetical protein [Mycobacterium sp.]